MGQNQKPSNKPTHIQSSNILTREPVIFTGERIVSSINVGKTGYAEERNCTPVLCHAQILTPNGLRT